MSKKANAETLRAIAWGAGRSGGVAMVNPEAVALACRAPADFLDRFNPDSVGLGYREAGEALKAAGTLRRAAAALDRVAVALCNGLPQRWDPARRARDMGLTEADSERLEADAERARARALEAVAVLFPAGAVEIETGGDPRGHVLKIWKTGERDSGSPIWSA
jgi:hypothetical protein